MKQCSFQLEKTPAFLVCSFFMDYAFLASFLDLLWKSLPALESLLP